MHPLQVAPPINTGSKVTPITKVTPDLDVHPLQIILKLFSIVDLDKELHSCSPVGLQP